MSLKERFVDIYDKHYKQLMILPVVLLVLAFIQIGYQVATTGNFVNLGVSLKGGSVITVLQPIDIPELQAVLTKEFVEFSPTVRGILDSNKIIGATIESAAQQDDVEDILTYLKQTGIKEDVITIEITGAALGQQFFSQAIRAMLVAFILMAIVVFCYFRTIVPSIAVVVAAFSDIIETIAIFNLLGMSLSTAGIAALLMLIGYSVDTDILLTSRVLRRTEGTVLERVFGAMRTGNTMIFTSVIAVVAGLVFTNSEVIRQIMVILLIGLLLDVINTWIQNAGFLRLYLERKHAP
ncbi:protein translocase subunit SecF [Candidatus Woesearchaeota archaeon]|nr:protein translocase subunit SecF [Candidatus Woesearchaeota archaeon]